METALDRFMPTCDFSETHATRVAATPAAVDAAVRDLDLGRSRIVRLLFRLRGMPTREMRLRDMQQPGFRILAEEPEREVVLGVIGRFWTPGGGVRDFEPTDFVAFDEPGWAKAVWGFRSTRLDDATTLLRTETRVLCTDAPSRRRFWLYWIVIRPFSGLIRRVALVVIRRAAEARR